jgi:hypothetical protein
VKLVVVTLTKVSDEPENQEVGERFLRGQDCSGLNVAIAAMDNLSFAGVQFRVIQM